MKSLKIEADASVVHPSHLTSQDHLDSKSIRNTPHSASSRRRLEQSEKKKRLSKAFPATSQNRVEEDIDGETFYKLVDREDGDDDRVKHLSPLDQVLPSVDLSENLKPSSTEGHRLDANDEPLNQLPSKSPMPSNRGSRVEQPLNAKPPDHQELFTSDQRKTTTVIPLIKQQTNKPQTEPLAQVMTEAQRRWDLFRNHCDSIRASWQ